MDTISILIITMGHYSINLVHGVTVLVLCISAISVVINTNGHNPLKRLHGVRVFVLCTSSNHGLHLYQVS